MSDERINIPYKGTPEQESQLAELLDDYKGTKSPLIDNSILHKFQTTSCVKWLSFSRM